ncbi:unnamed protein product [Cochlearia groenlandica]
MITALSWIPKGSLKPVPDVTKPSSKEETKEIIESNDFERKWNILKLCCSCFLHEEEETKEDDIDDDDDDDEEGIDDTTIKPTDSVIICARSEDEINHLEVNVYEESPNGSPNMFVHHHIITPNFPLCIALTNCPLKGGEKGNFVAVGSKDSPAIDIWDLDVRDEVIPCVQLGGTEETMFSKKEKYKEGSHTDSVLGLAWNKEFRNILASASVDKTVKVWDVVTEKCKITMDHHTKEKDCREPLNSGFKWSVMSDVESLAWDPHSEHNFVVSLEDGTVKGFDIRAAQSGLDLELRPSFIIQAHGQDKGVSSISYNLLATGCMDKTVKLWDLSNNEPSCIASHQPNAGAVFSISFAVDNPFLLAIGGSKGELHVWDTLLDAGVCLKYGNNQS